MSIAAMMQHTEFRSAERFIQRITLATLALCALLALLRGTAVDMIAYGWAFATGAGLISLGLLYRHSGRDQRLAATLLSAGWFVSFTLAMSLFNYLLLPHWAPTIDEQLAAIDAVLFGYHWPDFVATSASLPLLNDAMRFAYLSTLPQIALLTVILGLSGRLSELYALIVSVTIAGTITVVFWGWFPSLGPSAMYELSPELLAQARPVVGTAYGQEILMLFGAGNEVVAPDEIRGLIAFPSFHIVLALAATYYSRTVVWLFPAYLIVNALVVPGVLAHGGHHVVDIPAGLAVFVAAAWMTRRVVGVRRTHRPSVTQIA